MIFSCYVFQQLTMQEVQEQQKPAGDAKNCRLHEKLQVARKAAGA